MLNNLIVCFLVGEVCFMCKEKSCCEHPEKKVKDPKECSPEQIAECHPKSKGHPCTE